MSQSLRSPNSGKLAPSSDQARVTRSYGVVIGFTLLIGAMLAVHLGSVVNLVYPVLAALVGAFLLRYRQSTYIAFAWWIWLFTPEVRRIVDYQSAFHAISPVMTAPLFVTSISTLVVFSQVRVLFRTAVLPFLLILLVYIPALIIGILTNGFLPAMFDAGNWLEPLLFGVFLIMNSHNAAENEKAFLNAVIVGLIVSGAYGLYQFFNLPGWDSAWLRDSNFGAAGQGFAEQVRIWGTSNSPGPFGLFLAASLGYAFAAKGIGRMIGGTLGIAALGLCGVRSAWGAFAIAALFVIWRLEGKTRLRVMFAAVLIAGAAVPILTVGPVSTLVSARFSGLSSLQKDRSGTVRLNQYESLAVAAVTQPIGLGFGSLGISSKFLSATGTNSGLDSGLLVIPFTFGWFGTVIIVWALGSVSISVLSAYRRVKRPMIIASCGVFIGILSSIIFGNVLSGDVGMIIWSTAGFALSTRSTSKTKVASGFGIEPSVLMAPARF